ncbi:MAG: hypothetical protein HC866_16330 [Leptolyngbyaceae cyanobacterium RU_5_1]|nr:hypothetical protein [Leptolyngbyaceae cyanobacterium RU_5_1]
MREPQTRGSGVKYMLAGGSVVAALGLLIDPHALLPKPTAVQDVCQQIVDPKAILSRDQLSQLLTLPERTRKAQLRQLLQTPYCQLPNLEVRAGVSAERAAYPLAFDPQTWFIVLYEGDEYAGYSFSFRR